jgi:CRISPR-associated protein Cmr4
MKLAFVHAVSPIHVGTGKGSDVAASPVIREKVTGFPYLPAAVLSEALRSQCGDARVRARIFGRGGEADEKRQGLRLSDQVLLLSPVRSYRGTFAWVTCPLLLHRLVRDAAQVGVTTEKETPAPGVEETALMPYEASKTLALHGKVILEELDLAARGDAAATAWARWLSLCLFPEAEPDTDFWRETFVEHFCVVHDDVFSFLTENATLTVSWPSPQTEPGVDEQRTPRVVEALPAETVLWGRATAQTTEIFRIVEDILGQPLVVGAGRAVGLGLCRVRLVGK